MATEKRLIDANALVVFLKDQREKETGAYSKGRNNGLNVSISATQNEEICPAVDAVPVVRCKDCKHVVFDEGKGVWKCVESAEWDESIGDWFGFVSYKTHDFYCAKGERKDND